MKMREQLLFADRRHTMHDRFMNHDQIDKIHWQDPFIPEDCHPAD